MAKLGFVDTKLTNILQKEKFKVHDFCLIHTTPSPHITAPSRHGTDSCREYFDVTQRCGAMVIPQDFTYLCPLFRV